MRRRGQPTRAGGLPRTEHEAAESAPDVDEAAVRREAQLAADVVVEREVVHLGGIKSLYSDSIYTRDEFVADYDMTAYESPNHKYDALALLLMLYEKYVLRA